MQTEKPEPGSVWEEYKLQKEQELRIEVEDDKDAQASVKLIFGTAEMLGTELLVGKEYVLKGISAPFFSWHGCTIAVKGKPKHVYVADDTPMVSYINTHAALNNLRASARQCNGAGPRVLLAGPVDVGKSSLARILLSYAVRVGWKPTFVDIDVGQNDISVPGSLAATPIEHPIGIERSESISLKTPIAFFYGHDTPSKSESLYKKLVERLAKAVDERLRVNDLARHSGIIINTCGWVEGSGYDLLIHSIQTFRADVVLVVGQERLWSQLRNDARVSSGVGGVDQQAAPLGPENSEPVRVCPAILKLNKSGGVLPRDPTQRRRGRMTKIMEYFYGEDGKLCPHNKCLYLGDFHCYRTGGGPAAPSHTLPIGARPALDPDRLVRIRPSPELQNTLIAVSYATEEAALLDSNVAGFAQVLQVTPAQVTLLVPSPGPLPSNYFLGGSIKWLDE